MLHLDNLLLPIYKRLALGQKQYVHFIRIAIFVVMAWIGGLKAFQYEADGIVPFASNSPFMSFFYKNAAKTAPNDKGESVKEYVLYKNPEGKMVAQNIAWHKENGTYLFSYALGSFIVIIGLFTLLGIWFPRVGIVGGVLTFLMSLVTLSFLVTTPEAWVPNLGGDMPTPNYGFPYLSGVGRLVVKDLIMSAGGLIVASEAAKRILARIPSSTT